MMRVLKNVFKKILPQTTKNKLKVFLGEHPYILHPVDLMRRGAYKKQLEEILSTSDYKGIFIYPPTIDWHMPLFQRPQQLGKALAQKGYLFFYGTNNLRFDKVRGFEKISENLYLTNHIDLLSKKEDTILFISWPFNRHFVERFPKSRLVYDFIDELEVFDTSGKTAEEIKKSHEFLVQNADLTCCTADKLIEDIEYLKPKKSVLVPNGVDIEFFQNVKKFTLPLKEKRTLLTKKPMIGYYGALFQWFDYRLLEKVSVALPEYEFVMIGPLDYDQSYKDHKHLFNLKNVHFFGPKPYWQLPYYLSFFTVATIPFVHTKVTESTSPVKIFEYMAGGKPIISTNLRECRKYKSIYIAKNADEFIEKIREVIAKKDDPKYLKLLKKEATENTWQKRAEKIIGNL